MNIFTVCGFGLCAVCMTVIFKNMDNRFSVLIASAAGIAMLAYIAVQTVPVLQYVRELAVKSGMSDYFALAVKSLGIALLCQLASEICRDMGEASVGSRIELAGKVTIICMSLPVLKNIMSFAEGLL